MFIDDLDQPPCPLPSDLPLLPAVRRFPAMLPDAPRRFDRPVAPSPPTDGLAPDERALSRSRLGVTPLRVAIPALLRLHEGRRQCLDTSKHSQTAAARGRAVIGTAASSTLCAIFTAFKTAQRRIGSPESARVAPAALQREASTELRRIDCGDARASSTALQGHPLRGPRATFVRTEEKGGVGSGMGILDALGGAIAAVRFWWTPVSVELATAAEAALLRPFHAADASGERGEVSIHTESDTLDFAGTGRYTTSYNVRVVHASPPTSGDSASRDVPMLMLHGYGSGSALWTNNLRALTGAGRDGAKRRDVYAMDMLGCGLSERPRFKATTRQEVEDLYVRAVDEWLDKRGLEKVVLTGHSFGGYAAAVYALRRPQRVERLLLVSPVGVPEGSLDDIAKRRREAARARREAAAQGAAAGTQAEARRPITSSWWWPLAMSLVRILWWLGVTPNGVVRMLGPKGPAVVQGYAARRFVDGSVDKGALGRYLYQILAARGSGEYVLNRVLKPGAYAVLPLCHRLPSLDARLPVDCFYGDADWMDHKHFDDLVPHMPGQTRVHVVSRAGHYLFLDNHVDFNDAMLAVVEGQDIDDGRAARMAMREREPSRL